MITLPSGKTIEQTEITDMVTKYGVGHLEIIHDGRHYAIVRIDSRVDERGYKIYTLTDAHYERAYHIAKCALNQEDT